MAFFCPSSVAPPITKNLTTLTTKIKKAIPRIKGMMTLFMKLIRPPKKACSDPVSVAAKPAVGARNKARITR